MAVARIRHGVVVTADVRENRPKMKLDNNRVFEYAISFPDGLSGWPTTRLWRTRPVSGHRPGHGPATSRSSTCCTRPSTPLRPEPLPTTSSSTPEATGNRSAFAIIRTIGGTAKAGNNGLRSSSRHNKPSNAVAAHRRSVELDHCLIHPVSCCYHGCEILADGKPPVLLALTLAIDCRRPAAPQKRTITAVTDGPLPDGPLSDEPLPGQIPRLRFSPRRAARPSSPRNGGFSRLLSVGGAAALAMGGAAAAAMLTGGGTRKDHTSNGHENKAELSQKADQPAHPSDLDRPDLPRDNSGSRLGDGTAHLAREAADQLRQDAEIGDAIGSPTPRSFRTIHFSKLHHLFPRLSLACSGRDRTT